MSDRVVEVEVGFPLHLPKLQYGGYTIPRHLDEITNRFFVVCKVPFLAFHHADCCLELRCFDALEKLMSLGTAIQLINPNLNIPAFLRSKCSLLKMETDSLASTGISPPSGFNLQYGTFGDVIELGRAKVMGLERIPYTSIPCSDEAYYIYD
jgi:hypothetical protein